MARLWTVPLLCSWLTATLAGAALSPPAVLRLSNKIIDQKLEQELKEHDAISILKDLPLLSAVRQEPASGILGSVVSSVLKHIIWLKVTSANILQLQVEASTNSQELVVKIPLDMVAGFNTPLVKSIVEMHMESEAQAVIRAEVSKNGQTRLVFADCANSQGSLRISLLHKLSFLINPLADKVMSLLMPALPKLVKSQLCPVIKDAFEDMSKEFLGLLKTPISLSSQHVEFHLLSPAVVESGIQLNLGVTLLDFQGKVTRQFNESKASLTLPGINSTPFSLTVRQDVLDAGLVAMFPPEELMVLLDYVLPELALKMKSSLQAINEKAAAQLGPTQILKFLTLDNPELSLENGAPMFLQPVVLEVFATDQVHRPLFTLGIETSSKAQFYTEADRLMLSFNNVRSNRIHLMNSSIGLFNPELMKDVITEILASVLLPNENAKLRSGIPLSMVKALGCNTASLALTKDALVIYPDC